MSTQKKRLDFTSVDMLVQTWGMRNNVEFTYKPGSSATSFEDRYMILEDIEELIKVARDYGLTLSFSGEIGIWEPEPDDEHDEEPEAVEEEPRIEEKTPEEIETERIEKAMKDLDMSDLDEENMEVARDMIAMAEGTPLEALIPPWIREAVKVEHVEAVAVEVEPDEEDIPVAVEEELVPEALREIPDGEEESEK